MLQLDVQNCVDCSGLSLPFAWACSCYVLNFYDCSGLCLPLLGFALDVSCLGREDKHVAYSIK